MERGSDSFWSKKIIKGNGWADPLGVYFYFFGSGFRTGWFKRRLKPLIVLDVEGLLNIYFKTYIPCLKNVHI